MALSNYCHRYLMFTSCAAVQTLPVCARFDIKGRILYGLNMNLYINNPYINGFNKLAWY